MNYSFKKTISLTFLFALSLVMTTLGFSQEGLSTQKAGTFSFDTEEIDYGTIQQNADGVRTFSFTNTGNAPIVISNAKGSCGCTVPTITKKVVEPGETSEIKVKYDTKRLGRFSKTVTLTSNASEPKTLQILASIA